jgi:hypothetical protein
MPSPTIRDLFIGLGLTKKSTHETRLIATNRLFDLGPTRDETSAVRRVLSLQAGYRKHLLTLLLGAIQQLPDDRSLAETLEQLDHLSPELLPMMRKPLTSASGGEKGEFSDWNRAVWQSPDAITLLSKVVEQPSDVAEVSHAPIIAMGFNWLQWETPPEHPAPAPFADRKPLQDPQNTARHPFWGALVATLDACTGDYPWQSLMLRGHAIRSQHRTLGVAETQLAELWRSEFGLYPAPPLIMPEGITFLPGKSLPWLQPALESMAQAGAATLTEGSWRLTDAFRTRLLQDDEHMLAFEAIRRRSFRLAQAAERTVERYQQAVTL